MVTIELSNIESQIFFMTAEVTGSHRNPAEIMEAISIIDQKIFDIRFNSDLSDAKLVDAIGQLMEERNTLNEQFQAIRREEFHDFVNGLGLGELGITPEFTSPQSCQLSIQNPAANQLEQTPMQSDSFARLFMMFKSKKQTLTQLQILAAQRKTILSTQRNSLKQEANELKRKSHLTPSEIARKTRIKAEIESIDKASKKDKKGK